MAPRISTPASTTLTEWLDRLMTGQIGLQDLPPEVAAFYYLGHHHGTQTQQPLIDHLRTHRWIKSDEIINVAYELIDTISNSEINVGEIDFAVLVLGILCPLARGERPSDYIH
ncbi:hypothetical protein [Lysinibacter sp. HNR]|uniref:hypothetical protein n=1 Tax=Lysinibacter sp. HNR TaxID=3031408 RepID=UPI0024357DDC|nr:hypothetical protein [Lysinibacter sp. HNR]WGD37568.1 hypothetical protein FrondiHNR_01190 [Lysinibacter sp. HNR]